MKFQESPLDPTSKDGIWIYASLFNTNPYILMYATNSTYNGGLTSAVSGALNSRSAVNTLCANNLPSNYASIISNIQGFISISSTDQISDFPVLHGVPADKPIIGINGFGIASNWNDLLDGTIENTLQDALGISTGWWSGSLSNGSVGSTGNCSNWQDSTATFVGVVGNSTVINSNWINNGTMSCSSSNYLLCIAW